MPYRENATAKICDKLMCDLKPMAIMFQGSRTAAHVSQDQSRGADGLVNALHESGNVIVARVGLENGDLQLKLEIARGQFPRIEITDQIGMCVGKAYSLGPVTAWRNARSSPR